MFCKTMIKSVTGVFCSLVLVSEHGVLNVFILFYSYQYTITVMPVFVHIYQFKLVIYIFDHMFNLCVFILLCASN